jgi:amidophosphoribosyltransferase
MGIIRSHYLGRTFIQPSQGARQKGVRMKHSPNGSVLKGKRVVLIDDSIVRGTTSSQIIQMARESGARRVYMASAAPPVCFPNVYGIDMPTGEELVAHGRSVDEVCTLLGADRLIYQDLSDLVECARKGNPRIEHFDLSCFDGHYVTGDVSAGYLNHVESMRSDEAKAKRAAVSNSLQDLHTSAGATADAG